MSRGPLHGGAVCASSLCFCCRHPTWRTGIRHGCLACWRRLWIAHSLTHSLTYSLTHSLTHGERQRGRPCLLASPHCLYLPAPACLRSPSQTLFLSPSFFASLPLSRIDRSTCNLIQQL